jgi:DNA helicase-2/ATP-dependent DNA helicase PcrA
MSLRFPVLLHAAFYAALRRLPAERRSRFRRLAEALASGRWGGGTRVKKLRAFSKPVFEARQDDGDRVLFTLARSASPDGSGTLATHIQIWDLVEHDRVSAGACRVNRSPEAEFLDYEELESETTAEPPPHPGASFDEIPPAEPGAVPGVLEVMLPPDDFRPRDREEITGGVRWYVLPQRLLADDGEWQALMDRGGEELELKLTAEQYAVVRAPGPLLLSGSAGSGKTTMAVHRLAAAACGAGSVRALYLTYSRWLRDHARRLFDALLACRGWTPAAVPDFLTVEELYRSLLGREGHGAGRLVDYPEFCRWYAGTFRRADSALAWEEIRSIVKGACLDPGRAFLRRDEYEALGRKRAPLFVGERPRLYDVALRWQERVRAGGLADEIDLCRLALGRIGPRDAWDHVICDEAQDLAEIQVELLLRLHRGPRLEGLFLAGDPQQVINPSGFRWAEVRTAIRERLREFGRAVPALTTLTRNFRSVRGLVDLANEILAWKRERTGRSEGDEAEESVVAGATPIRVDGDEDALGRVVAGFGPRCAIVVGAEEIRSRLQVLLDTTRIFTVPEAKGLEFDVVVLWGAVGADPEPWRRLLDPSLDLREDPACRRALHHLYVAVTRARRHLAVYEPAGVPPVWTSPRFAPRLDAEPPASLGRLFVRAASPSEWVKEGEYFLERGRHRQAAECFRRAGEARREAECLALHHEQAGEGALAARLWLELGQLPRAARCFEAAGAWTDAARLWVKAGDAVAARRCDARAAEHARDWTAAGAAWEALEAWEQAARCWANAGLRPRQLRVLAEAEQAKGRWADAARRWEEVEAWERAVAAWRHAGRPGEASRAEALSHEAARRWAEAARAWREAGDERRALRATAAWAEEERRWTDAAPVWERLGDAAAAGRAWKRAGQTREATLCEVRVSLAEGRYVRAAETLEQVGELAAAAGAWSQAHEAGQQPVRPVPLVLPGEARTRWVDGGKPARLLTAPRHVRRGARRPGELDSRTRGLACAVTAAETAGRLDEAEEIWKALREPDQALRCRVTRLERAGQLAAVASLLEERRLFEGAAQAWARAGEPSGRVRCEAKRLEKKKRWDEAAARWGSLGETKEAARCQGRFLLSHGDYARAAQAFAEAGDADAALQMRLVDRQLAGDWDTAIRLAHDAGRSDLADSLRHSRDAWLATGRSRPRRRAKPGRPVRRAVPGPHAVQESLFSGPDPAPAPGPGRTCAPSIATPAPADPSPSRGVSAIGRVAAAVHRHPGVRAPEVVALTGLPQQRVQGLLRAAVAAGTLVKSGATRGTRYWPAGTSLPARE